MEVDVGQADLGQRFQLGAAVEVAVPQQRSGRAGEDERVGLILGEAREVPAKVGDDHVGERHIA